jgi:hypothetical protein
MSGLCFTGPAAAQTQTLNLPPLNGFQPLVVIGLTDEQVPGSTFDSFAKTSDVMGGNTLPIGGPQKFFTAVIDTGAQASILSYAATNQINLGSANREGNYTQTIIGASGQEVADIGDPIGIYMTGLNQATGGSNLGVIPGATFKGMWNTSPLTAESGSVLPNIIGSPVISLYQTQIKNSQPFHVTAGSTTFRSPLVQFAAPNTAIPSSYGKIAVTSTNTVGGPPTYFPSLDNFENFGDNPTLPTVWESIFANVTTSHTGGSSTASFLFDTGAEVSVLSDDTAANIGIFTAGENATPPDFTVEVVGVGGATQEVPGYYINSLGMTSTAGPLNFTRVPVIVLNLPDPRNPNETLPGVIGTNLFTARDLIINMGTGTSGIYVSSPWAWKFNGSGNWSDSAKWNLALPNGIDTQANFFGAITSPATVTVDGAGFTVGSVAFDNVNRYTLNGPGRITLDVSVGNAQLNVSSGSHTINAPMTFADDTDITVAPASSRLTITSDVTATGVAINKQGPGTLEMKNVRAAALAVNEGAVSVISNGTTTATSKVTALTIAGGTTPTAKLDLTNNAMVIDYAGTSPLATIVAQIKAGYASGAWTGNGIASSSAAAAAGTMHKTAIGYAEASAIGNPATFRGQSADSTSLLLRYVYVADANLDGKVDTLDFNALAANFGATGKNWWQGDNNYDGVVDTLDFNFLASNFGQTLPDDASLQSNLVPEPSSMAAVALLAGPALLKRRRRFRA